MKKYKELFTFCFIAAAIGTFSLFAVFFSAGITSGEQRTMFNRVLGLIFWTSFISELILFYKVDVQRKVISVIEGYNIEHGKAGIFSFRKNKFGNIADAVMIVSVAVFILLILKNVHARSVIIICTGLLYLSAVMHCIFNGKNFRFLCDHGIKEK